MKTPKSKVIQNNTRKPITIKDPSGYLHKKPTWYFLRFDKTFISPNKNGYEISIVSLLSALSDYETMTWNEIIRANGGRKCGNNNHFIPISKMTQDAQKQAQIINLNEDELFSLRINGKTRLFGIIDDGKFFMIWYDPGHGVYKPQK